MTDDLQELYQQVILDHSRKPRNFGPLAQFTQEAEGRNPLCGDHYKVFVQLEGDVIREVGFEGSGCAISKAAASLMTEAVKGRTRTEAERLFDRFHEVVTAGQMDWEQAGKLAAFAGVHKFPARVKCAILSWHALKAALAGGQASVSTEDDLR